MGQTDAVQISARGDYAVRAAVALAVAYPRTVSAQALAAEQEMPRKFLETILADLRRAGLVQSTRGVDGGYALSRPPAEGRMPAGEALTARARRNPTIEQSPAPRAGPTGSSCR